MSGVAKPQKEGIERIVVALTDSFLSNVVGLQNFEFLASVICPETIQQEGTTSMEDSKCLEGITGRMNNAQTLSSGLLQRQRRGLIKTFNDSEERTFNVKISLKWAVHAEAILDILSDAARLDLRTAFLIGRDYTKLELLQ